MLSKIREFISGFFKKIADWFKSVWNFVQNKKRHAVRGAKVFLTRIGNQFRMFADYYSACSNSSQFRKTSAYSEELIDFQDVPQAFLRKYYSSSEDSGVFFYGNMVDISQELQLYS